MHSRGLGAQEQTMKNISSNTSSYKQLIALVATFIVAVIVGVFILYPRKSLPIIQPGDLNPALVDAQDWNR